MKSLGLVSRAGLRVSVMASTPLPSGVPSGCRAPVSWNQATRPVRALSRRGAQGQRRITDEAFPGSNVGPFVRTGRYSCDGNTAFARMRLGCSRALSCSVSFPRGERDFGGFPCRLCGNSLFFACIHRKSIKFDPIPMKFDRILVNGYRLPMSGDRGAIPDDAGIDSW
jgi:hypothetical protein